MVQRQRLQLEYLFSCSPRFLFPYISSANGLEGWLADSVRVDRKTYRFGWTDEERAADMVELKQFQSVRFAWKEPVGEFLEMSLKQDELTGDTSLIIVDFIDDDEEEQYRMVWDNSVSALRSLIGA